MPEDPKTKGKTKAKVPALVGDSSRPTFGKAARMVFDDTSRVATLSGGATLWQGASSLFGDDVTLNDADPDPAAHEWVRGLSEAGSLRHRVHWLRQEANRLERDREPVGAVVVLAPCHLCSSAYVGERNRVVMARD